MLDLGFKQLKRDFYCFLSKVGKDQIFITAWVNDIVVSAGSEEAAKWFEDQLERFFKIKRLDCPNLILSIGVNFGKDGSIFLIQSHYINTLLTHFELIEANSASTPFDPHVNLNIPNSLEVANGCPSEDSCRLESYATIIGSLLYLAIATCPNIVFAVHKLAQFTLKP